LQRRTAAAQHPTYWRIIPLFQAPGEDHVTEGGERYVIHTLPGDLMVATVPSDACTIEAAKKLEAYLMEKTQHDVLVVSDNVKFLKVEEVPRSEMAALLKDAVDGPDAEKKP